ncbi:hypothetical protein B0H21DRAFT_719065 [Amylocystis lapponica]|nr:hypothetical protein B0H21DRAFT_719065 [Amylocystis lapponica]
MSAQASREIDGVPTEVLLQAFADRILVLVTQVGKVGNLIQVTIPQTTPLMPPPPPDPSQPNAISLPTPPASIQLTPLLGNASTERLRTLYSLYASQLATNIWTAESEDMLEGDRRMVVVGLALRRSVEAEGMGLSAHEKNVFYGVMGMVNELVSRR